MTSEKPMPAGQRLNIEGDKVISFSGNAYKAIFLILAAVLLGGLDIYLAVIFMKEFSLASQSTTLTTFFTITSWFFTIATTGLNYAMWDRMDHGFRGRPREAQIMIVVTWTLGIMDSILDVGGWTALLSPVDNGRIVPENPDIVWMFTAPIIFLVCFAHEMILWKMLERYKDDAKNDELVGEWMVRWAAKIAAWSLSAVKVATKFGGLGAMLGLDIILLPQTTEAGVYEWVAWGFSVGLTGLIWVVWEWHRRVGGFRVADTQTKVLAIVAWTISILDTFLDVVGFNAVIYGSDQGYLLLPPGGFSAVNAEWLISVLIVGMICWAAEPLWREMYWRPREGETRMPGGLPNFATS